tara:strand:+ start:1843 stop:2583 length:741 start_codon:yes stop_codon:yes gene_type:complete
MGDGSAYNFYSSINGTWDGRYNPSEIRDRTANHRAAGYGMVLIDSATVSGSTTHAVEFTSITGDPIKDFRRYGLLWVVGHVQNDDPTYGQMYYHYAWDKYNKNYYYHSMYSTVTNVSTAWAGRNGTSPYNYGRYVDWSYGGFWAGMVGSSDQTGSGAGSTSDNWGMTQAWFSGSSNNRIGGQVMMSQCTQLSDNSTSGYLVNFVAGQVYGDKIDCIVALAEQMTGSHAWTAGSTFELYGYPRNTVS